ncbi:MAG: IS5 family transposase [Gemmataceae bacterium]
MTPKRVEDRPDLFHVALDRVINLDHPLAKLTEEFDWELIHTEIEPLFCDTNGRPGADSRVVVGLFYLKSAFNLSDEQLLARWVENPYWQWFCGFRTMQHEAPIDPTTLTRWRSRLGAEKLELLLKQTLEIARDRKLLKRRDLADVNVDTTVQPKAIAFPTDSRLYFKMRRALVRQAVKGGIQIRQSYRRVAKGLLVSQSRFAHAKQYGRARRSQVLLRGILGRLLRDIGRKMDQCEERQKAAMEALLAHGQRLWSQERKDKNKLYSVHEPHVECISKGKAHRRYEFGCKVSVVVANRSNWVLGVQALHGNPFDGHTLSGAIRHLLGMTGVLPERIFVDKGYKGHGHGGPGEVHVAGRIPRDATRTFRKLLRRRSVIEPTIGHMKSDHRLERNFLKGKEGDRINALMAAVGYNLAKLLRAFGWLEEMPTCWASHILQLTGRMIHGWFDWFLPKMVAA